MQKISLLSCTKEDLDEFVVTKLKEKPFRVRQVLHWIYKKKETNIMNFSNLPLQTREKLDSIAQVYTMQLSDKQISRQDGTVKYIFQTYDGYNIPAVFIPKIKRNVVCVSTQIGCSIGCKFCNSGKNKFVRNLSCEEIVEQVYRIYKDFGDIDGILFMGMGEPLLNYHNLVKSIKIFLDTEMFSLSKRRVTVSTVGIVPNIYKLAEENLKVKLAISLHSYDDKKRKEFIKNLNFTVKEILTAGIFYAKKTKTNLTIEYVLIKDKNDTEKDAIELTELLKMLIGREKRIIKINLIPYNSVVGCTEFYTPSEGKVEHFKQVLVKNGFLTFIRKPYGEDINAACGQLGF